MNCNIACALAALGMMAATNISAQQAPAVNARQLPDISAVGDMVIDMSPKGSTQESGNRFTIREVELALQAPVDPYFRGDVFLGFNDAEGVHIEQAFLTATALPFALEGRIGRFLMPIGKQNTTHRHDLHAIDHSYVVQDFLGEEGLKGTGVWLSRVIAPFGFYQELQLTAVDALAGDHDHGHEDESSEPELEPETPANRRLDGLGYSARLRNYFDLSEAANLELSFSAATGKRAAHFVGAADQEFALNTRQSIVGADMTYRWRPLQQGLYKSFIVQAEVLRQLNEDAPSGLASEDGDADRNGAYVFARYQLTRRMHLGARADWLEDGEAIAESLDDTALKAGSAYLEFFPSEFSKLSAGFERIMPAIGTSTNRILLQATFAVGPHKPHPF